ncbi:MAG TPA: amino acid ABC transporter permease [Actinomycetota bacterium]|nr:amino acid ABC transporter permease [Actinomycetota bacterium]
MTALPEETVRIPNEALRPPVHARSPREWIKENLFPNAFNSVLTVVFGAIIMWAVVRTARFVFVTAQWSIVRANLTNFMVGFFPRDEIWRIWVAMMLLAVVTGLRWGSGGRRRIAERTPQPLRQSLKPLWPPALLAVAIIVLSGSAVTAGLITALFLAGFGGRIAGAALPQPIGRWTGVALAVTLVVAYVLVAGPGGSGASLWRGLLLTMALAAAGIALSFPIGVLLALGRRSSFPAIRVLCVGYIELIRGVPLITLLFMAFLILGFFLPPGAEIPTLVTRALVALVLFTAAYLAEVVRGGLQAVPKGQIEAAQALGLSPVTITRRIVLPQALRAVLPAIVGQFISLFKDTSLVGFIGLTELLGVAQQVTKQPEFLGLGLHAETLVFASFIYWVGAYGMSRASQRMETRLGVGER